MALRWGVVAVLALLAAATPPAIVWTKGSSLSLPFVPQLSRAAYFEGEISPEAQRLANWIARSNDHADTNFVLVDKKSASIHVFDAQARLLGSSPVLLGGAPGDDTVPGIGNRPIAEVWPEERTTPAGRFVAERGRNMRGEDVVWVSYQDALSMHRVLTTNPQERRLERLETPSPDDNRISYGCINVPVEFYEKFIRPAFATHRAAVYILPEVKSLEEVFSLRPGSFAS